MFFKKKRSGKKWRESREYNGKNPKNSRNWKNWWKINKKKKRKINFSVKKKHKATNKHHHRCHNSNQPQRTNHKHQTDEKHVRKRQKQGRDDESNQCWHEANERPRRTGLLERVVLTRRSAEFQRTRRVGSRNLLGAAANRAWSSAQKNNGKVTPTSQ